MQDQIIAQRYRLLEQLGQGGMGSVWSAEHIALKKPVAVKLMNPELATNAEGLVRFKREAQAAANLDSPHIVSVFDYGIENGTPYIVMERLKGESLADRLKHVGRIAPNVLASIYLQLGKAMSKAHVAGVVHRDLKPDNIFLVAGDEGDIVKVIDFGIAKRTGITTGHLSAAATQTGAMLGTPHYMSPEQASDSKSIDHRCDIWSLGIIAFECLTGMRPFQSDSLGGFVLAICTGPIVVPSKVAAVPAGFDEWFARCAARDPNARFPSAFDATVALAAVCIGAAEIDEAEDTNRNANQTTIPWETTVALAAVCTDPAETDEAEDTNRNANPTRIPWTVLLLIVPLVAVSTLLTWGYFWWNSGSASLLVRVTTANATVPDQFIVDVDGASHHCATVSCRIEGLTRGRHVVAVRGEGYEASTPPANVFLERREERAIELKLVARGATLVIPGKRGPGSLQALVDGKDYGKCPTAVNVTPGSHTVGISDLDRYYETTVVTVDVKPGETREVQLQQKVMLGVVAIEAGEGADGAQVQLDCRQRLPESLQLPTTRNVSPGDCTVVASKAGYGHFSRSISFDDGTAESTVRVTMDPARREPESAKAPPPGAASRTTVSFFATKESCNVTMGGRAVGRTPVTVGPVTPGNGQYVECSWPNGKTTKRPVDVRAGRRNQVVFQFPQ